jgi:hypothetical protein
MAGVKGMLKERLKAAAEVDAPDDPRELTPAMRKNFSHVRRFACQFARKWKVGLLEDDDDVETWLNVKEHIRGLDEDDPEFDKVRDEASLYVTEFVDEQRRKGTKTGARVAGRIRCAFDKWRVPYHKELRDLIKTDLIKEDRTTSERKRSEVSDVDRVHKAIREGLPRVIAWLAKVALLDFRMVSGKFLRDMDEGSAIVTYAPEHLRYFTGNMTDVDIARTNGVTAKAAMQDDNLRVYLMATRAILSIMSVTGLRSKAFWDMEYADLMEVDGADGVLLRYKSWKTGRSSADFMYHFVRVVYNADPAADPVVHLHQFLYLTKSLAGGALADPDHPFRMNHKDNSHWWKRIVTIATVAARAVGAEEMFSTRKKLHALRGFCASELANRGATAEERHDMLGWGTVDTEGRHYVDNSVKAKANKGPFLIAGRLIRNSDDDSSMSVPAPGMWQVVDESIQGMSTTDKVVFLAAAAGLPGVPEAGPPPHLCTLVRQANNASEDTGRGTKRQAEREAVLRAELAVERNKRARLEVAPGEEGLGLEATIEAFRGIFKDHIEPHCRKADFPSICRRAVLGNNVVNLMDAIVDPNAQRGFGVGVPQHHSEFWRKFTTVLRLAATHGFHQGVTDKSPTSSWFPWARANLGTIKVHAGGANMNKWAALREQITKE